MSGETKSTTTDLDVSVSENIENMDSIAQEAQELAACENVHPLSSGFFATKFRNAGEWIASRPWGQMVFKSVDRVLWCVERTLLWQNPTAVPDKLSPMTRPINAVVAYPLAALLWVLQHLMLVSGGTSENSSKAVQMINWVRTRRRRLRAVRFLGIRNMRKNNQLGRPEKSSALSQVSWFLGLSSAVESEVEEKVVADGEEVAENGDAPVGATDESEQKKKRRFSDVSITTDEGAVLSLDDEYNSDSDDSDYVPDYTHSSESSESDLSSVDEDEEEDAKDDAKEKSVDADKPVEGKTEISEEKVQSKDEPTQ